MEEEEAKRIAVGLAKRGLRPALHFEVYQEMADGYAIIQDRKLQFAETEQGVKYADECMRRIYDARMKGVDGKISVPSKFVAGVPKEDHWVRIQVTDLLTADEVDELLSTYQLASKPQENGYLLIHGTKENVKALIRAMGQKLRSKST